MALAQHVLSGGATTYDKFVGASVITFVMFLIHTFVYSLLRLDRWFYWLTYVPSFLVLAILTDVSPDGEGGVYNYMWLWLAPLIIIFYIVMVRLFSEVDGLGKDNNASGFIFSKVMWANMLSITIMMLAVVGTGNTDITFHHRIKIENHLLAGDIDEALRVGREYEKTDASLTMLRAYALAMQGQLPERLFEYPVTGGAASLRPDGKDVKSIMIHNGDIVKFIHSKRIGCRDVEADYKLCGELADCRLDMFKKHLPEYYSVDSQLPKHYKEALLMTDYVTGKDSVDFISREMQSDYNEFVKLSKDCSSNKEHCAALKERFFNTYWYYYYSNSKR